MLILQKWPLIGRQPLLLQIAGVFFSESLKFATRLDTVANWLTRTSLLSSLREGEADEAICLRVFNRPDCFAVARRLARNDGITRVVVSQLATVSKIVQFPWMVQGATEWDRHATLFSQRWKRTMRQRGKIQKAENFDRKFWVGKILEAETDQDRAKVMEKDIHLIATAFRENAYIASLDNKARQAFKNRAAALGVSDLVWVNPTENPDEVLRWLQEGAAPQPEFQMKSGIHD